MGNEAAPGSGAELSFLDPGQGRLFYGMRGKPEKSLRETEEVPAERAGFGISCLLSGAGGNIPGCVKRTQPVVTGGIVPAGT